MPQVDIIAVLFIVNCISAIKNEQPSIASPGEPVLNSKNCVLSFHYFLTSRYPHVEQQQVYIDEIALDRFLPPGLDPECRFVLSSVVAEVVKHQLRLPGSPKSP